MAMEGEKLKGWCEEVCKEYAERFMQEKIAYQKQLDS